MDIRFKAGAIVWYEKEDAEGTTRFDGTGTTNFVKTVSHTIFSENAIHHEEKGYLGAGFIWLPVGSTTASYQFDLQQGLLTYTLQDHSKDYSCVYRK